MGGMDMKGMDMNNMKMQPDTMPQKMDMDMRKRDGMDMGSMQGMDMALPGSLIIICCGHCNPPHWILPKTKRS